MLAERIWGRFGVPNLLLSPLSAAYAVGWLGYQSLYGLRLKEPARVASPVLTIGNLAVGGSGKTPFVLWLAKSLADHGRDCAVLMSGYGSLASHGARIAPEGVLDAREYGDEPALARWVSPGLKLAIGRDRVMAARLAAAQWPGLLLLMDDGFQHLRLQQDVTLVLDPPRQNRMCFPAGPYREPRRTGLARADMTVPSAIYRLVASPTTFIDQERKPVETGGQVQVLTAIARPERLLASLREGGLSILKSVALPDHHPLSDKNLFEGFDLGIPVVVTTKDWVKLRERADIQGFTFWIADYTVSVDPAEAFLDELDRRIDETVP